jgi:hypothetical protein
LYVALATVLAVKLIVLPAHRGLFDEMEGAAGVGLTTTVTVLTALVHPETVAVRLYVPLAAIVEFGMEGLCTVEVNPFGPLQEYVAFAIVLATRFNVDPAQTGLFELTIGATGIGFTVTTVLLIILVQPFVVIVNEYVPELADVAFVIVGF